MQAACGIPSKIHYTDLRCLFMENLACNILLGAMTVIRYLYGGLIKAFAVNTRPLHYLRPSQTMVWVSNLLKEYEILYVSVLSKRHI